MLLNVFKTKRMISFSMLALFMLSSLSYAEELNCDNPPGPSGQIICEDNQICACKTDSKSVKGYCFNKNSKSANELKLRFIFEITGVRINQDQFIENNYDDKLRKGRIELPDGSVVTFTPFQ